MAWAVTTTIGTRAPRGVARSAGTRSRPEPAGRFDVEQEHVGQRRADGEQGGELAAAANAGDLVPRLAEQKVDELEVLVVVLNHPDERAAHVAPSAARGAGRARESSRSAGGALRGLW